MNLYEKLRQPEFQKRRNPQSLALLLDKGKVDIVSPFRPWEIPEAPTWKEQPYQNDTWGLYYHSLGWMVILDYGIDHASTAGKREFCSVRLRQLLFSYLAFLAYTPEEQLPKMAWFDHATAWRASALAYFMERRFGAHLTSPEKVLVDKVVLLHEAKLRGYIDSGRWNANNHGLFHAEALWDMTQVFTALSPESADVALSHMRTVLGTMIDFEEGVCREHSIYYHLFDAWLLAESSRYMRAFDIEVIPGYREVLRKMVQFYQDFSGGRERLHAVGDTQYGKKRANRMLEEVVVAAEYKEGSRIGRSWDRFRAYPRNGYYFFANRASPDSSEAFAILLDKPYIGAHGHFDGGSFTIDYGNEHLVVDSGGPFAYGNRLRFDYFKAAEAHNVVVFDRRSQKYRTAVTSSTEAHAGNAVRMIAKDLKDAEWQRGFVAIDHGVFLVIDHVVRSSEGDVHALVHLAPGSMVNTLERNCFSAAVGREDVEILFVSNVELKCGVDQDGLEFPRGMITRELGQTEPAPVLSAGFRTKEAWLVTAISKGAVRKVMVHTLYGGKMLRITVPDASSPVVVECNLTDPASKIRINTYRDYRATEEK